MAGPRAIVATAQERGRLWIENQDPVSRTGAGVGWIRRYQAADGQLYALMLTAYFLMTGVPLLIVYSTYIYDDPLALAHRLEDRLNLEASTSKALESVISGAADHRFSALLIAVISVFFFGLGFGRVMQLVHARSWGFDLRKRALVDQLLYLEVFGVLALLLLLYVLQTKALEGQPSWIGWLLAAGWLGVLVAFFTYLPWRLLDHRVAAWDILPGAVFTVLGFVAMRLVSGFFLRRWLEWYSQSYGGFGFVMAIFFWLIIFATILVLAAALSPTLAQRRDLRAAQLTATLERSTG
jgi:membrane protein